MGLLAGSEGSIGTAASDFMLEGLEGLREAAGMGRNGLVA